MLPADESANVDHSIWCQQVAEQDFEYVGCTCGALKWEMKLRAQEGDAARWRWCVENPYEAMGILMEATSHDSYEPPGRDFTIEDVREYFKREVDGWPERLARFASGHC